MEKPLTSIQIFDLSETFRRLKFYPGLAKAR